MKLTPAAFIAPVLMVALTGCTGEVTNDEGVGASQEALLSSNLLSSNLLSSNLLSSNLLSSNLLSSNSLGDGALAALEDPSATGDGARELLKYTVGCALDPSQSVSISWTDAQGNPQSATYVGQLGLAPDWAHAPLTRRSDQEYVSACLAARTNYFGVTVQISVRGYALSLIENTSAAELAAFPYVEGAFWGNLFSSTPYLDACDVPANAAHSNADMRDCATGHPDPDGGLDSCGMIGLTGSCEEQCAWFDSTNQLYAGCGGSWDVITIGLQ
jgi:hypothetical protein